MIKYAKMRLALAATATIALSGASDAIADSPDKPLVFVTVGPQAYMVERIADGHIDVDTLVGPGQNPHTYEPTPKQMTRLSSAKVFLRAGLPFEDSLLPRLSPNKQLLVVDTRTGIALLPEVDDEDAEHDGAAADHPDHHDGDMDPHIWLSPRLAKKQASTICETLVEIDPAHKDDYEKNLQRLDTDLDNLNAQIAAALAPVKGKAFFVFHPAFGYFAREYGLRQEAVETGGKTPGPRHVKELIDRARREGVRVIFVEPQFSQQTAKTIAEQIGGVVVAIDPLSKEYLTNLADVANKIHDALVPAAPSGP